MNQELRQQITYELRVFLNREPSEKEIMNAQTDINIMGKVREKKQIKLEVDVDNLKKQR